MSDAPPPVTSSNPTPDTTTSRPPQTRRRNNNNINVLSTNPAGYEGECPAHGSILGMRVEKFHKKLPFHQFTEKTYFYIVTNYKDGGDLYPLFNGMEDPLKVLIKRHKPVKPEPSSDEEDDDSSLDSVDKEIYREEVKQFVQRKLNLRRNMEKSYGLVWGQCSAALQSYMKGLRDYTKESSVSNITWLLQEL